MRHIAGTGHRPETLPEGAVHKTIKGAIQGFVSGIGEEVSWKTGGQRGLDLWLAQAALKEGHEVNVYLPFPVEIFTQNWRDRADVDDLHEVLERANSCHVIGQAYDVSAYKKRDRKMVEDASEVFALWDGRTKGGTSLTVTYGRKMKRELMIMDPITLNVVFES